MTPPKVGTIWERDGQRREVVSIDYIGSTSDGEKTYNVHWRRPIRGAFERGTWCAKWDNWQANAILVKDCETHDGDR